MFLQPRNLVQAKKTANYVWVAFMASVLVYVAVAYFFANKLLHYREYATPADQIRTLTCLLLLSGLSIHLAILFFRKKLPLLLVRSSIHKVIPEPNMPDSDYTHRQTAAASLTYYIILAAGCDACGGYGLFIVLRGADFSVIFLFVFLALIGFVLYRPDDAFIERVGAKVREWQEAGLIPGETTDKSRAR